MFGIRKIIAGIGYYLGLGKPAPTQETQASPEGQALSPKAQQEMVGRTLTVPVYKQFELVKKYLADGNLIFAQWEANKLEEGTLADELIKEAKGSPIKLEPGQIIELKCEKPIQIGSSLFATKLKDSPIMEKSIQEVLKRFFRGGKYKEIEPTRLADVTAFITRTYGRRPSILDTKAGNSKALDTCEFIYIGNSFHPIEKTKVVYIYSSPITNDKGKLITSGYKDRLLLDRFDKDSLGENDIAILTLPDGSFIIYRPTEPPKGCDLANFKNAPFAREDRDRILDEIISKFFFSRERFHDAIVSKHSKPRPDDTIRY